MNWEPCGLKESFDVTFKMRVLEYDSEIKEILKNVSAGAGHILRLFI